MTDREPRPPPDVAVEGMTKSFGAVEALKDVSLHFPRGAFHALLGENGAGKSTFAKCLMGYYQPDYGTVKIDGRPLKISSTRDAHAASIGMVYQHFSLAPQMTVAENLVIARPDNDLVIDWRAERRRLEEFVERMPFRIDLARPTGGLAAGEKQKIEILKQLYLDHRFLILDEPTSVLTPAEATELFSMLRQMCDEGKLSVLLITHKFREVFAFAREVTVLRRGEVVAQGPVSDFDATSLANAMIGTEKVLQPVHREGEPGTQPRLRVSNLTAENDKGGEAVRGVSFELRNREILGVAGVSGNGQRELVEVLAGQRPARRGEIRVNGEPYHARRAEMVRHKFYCLPEEPLHNACARNMTVAENLALRDFDRTPKAIGKVLLNPRAIRAKAVELISRYGVHTSSPDALMTSLSGGNVQRTVLARELSHDVDILIAANPCSGLDVGAISEIHAELLNSRNRGTAVLLVSEDLDELLALSDRLLVIFEGKFVYECSTKNMDVAVIGRHMAGQFSAA